MTNANETVEATALRLEASEGGAAAGARKAREFATWSSSRSPRRAFWLEVARTLESVAE